MRDYIHVWDLATAHVAALTRFDSLPRPATPINLGTGTATTVRELLCVFNRASDRAVRALEAGRRPGDTAGAYTTSTARRACWAGGRATTSLTGSLTPCSGPRR